MSHFLKTLYFSPAPSPDTSVPLSIPLLIPADFDIVAPPLKVYQQRQKLTTENQLVPPPPPSSAADSAPKLPIALRKGTCSCTTKHPIFVVYFSHLLTSFLLLPLPYPVSFLSHIIRLYLTLSGR